MISSARPTQVRWFLASLLAVAAFLGGCGTVSGFAEDLKGMSSGVQTAFTGDDPDSPAND
jgi:predicted small secreted protein